MRRSVSLFIVVAVLAALGYGVSNYLGKRKFVETDNAYTTGDILDIGSQLDDVVLWLGAEEGDYVEQGQELILLDGGMPKNRLARAQSELARTVQDVAALKRYLANDRIDQVTFSVLKHLAVYAAGRSLSYNEFEVLKKKSRELSADDLRAQSLLKLIINSDLFLKK